MKTFKNGSKKLIYDPIRQILIQHTPEEEVRQEIIQILIKEMNIPKDAISTEFPLNHINKKTRKRADIVVWHRDRDGNEYALLVLEIKSNHVDITDHTLEQVKSYNKVLKAKYIGTANGKQMNLYVTNGNKITPLTDELYTYSQLLEGKVKYTKYRELRRLPYELTTYNRYVQHLWDKGYIGEGTAKELHPFISELQNYILCGEVNESNEYTVSIIEDLSYGYFSFGNAGGGKYPGYYRSFIVKDIHDVPFIFRIGVFGTPITKNDPRFGNRSGNTYLTVAADSFGISTNVLQLNLDKFLEQSKLNNEYKIYHNGRRNGYKNSEVLEAVRKNTKDLIEDKKILLGTLPSNKSITSKEGTAFIYKLLDYATIRASLNKK